MGRVETVIKLEQFSERGLNDKWRMLTFEMKDLYTNIPSKSALVIAKMKYWTPDFGGRSTQTPNDNDIHLIHK